LVKDFEFIVPGIPLSLQTKNRARLVQWEKQVRTAARKRWRKGRRPIRHEVELRVTYYYEQSAPDSDNIVKPVQDALAGLIYVNDRQVVDSSGHKRRLDGAFRVRGMSLALAMGFSLAKVLYTCAFVIQISQGCRNGCRIG
jgi:crossover junction endodeoxyribonuclease RusA